MELLSIFNSNLPNIGKEDLKQTQILALIIRDLEGKILLVRENHSEHNRQWNIVTETYEACDQNLDNTTKAAILEEITAGLKDFWIAGDSYQSNLCTDYCLHSAVLVYTGNKQTNFSPIDPTEIVGYQWVGLPELEVLEKQGQLEPEVLPFVKSYQDLGFLNPLI